MKLYTKIKHLLIEFPELRDSDKKLVWKVWTDEGSVHKVQWLSDGLIYMHDFIKATDYESISRARRVVQSDCPELQSSDPIKRAKRIKQSTKGTYVYRETFTGKLFN